MKNLIRSLTMMVLFCTLTYTVVAQEDTAIELKYVSIAGQITDTKTKEVLSGVKITNESRNNTVVSKRNGFYSIVAVTGDIIRFSHVGYEPIYMRVNKDASSKETIMIKMDASDIYLDEAVVGNLPSLDQLDEAFMALEVDDDLSRELAEQNPETFRILDEIDEPVPAGPVSFLKKHVFDKIKEKSKKPGRAKKLPKFKD